MLRKLFGLNSDSETIVWARLQMIGGCLLAGLNEAGIAPVMNSVGLSRWAPIGVALMGVVTEYLRRRRATDL